MCTERAGAACVRWSNGISCLRGAGLGPHNELGFGDQVSRNDIELGAAVEVSLHDIYARAIALGFELRPAEVLALRCPLIASTSRSSCRAARGTRKLVRAQEGVSRSRPFPCFL